MESKQQLCVQEYIKKKCPGNPQCQSSFLISGLVAPERKDLVYDNVNLDYKPYFFT